MISIINKCVYYFSLFNSLWLTRLSYKFISVSFINIIRYVFNCILPTLVTLGLVTLGFLVSIYDPTSSGNFTAFSFGNFTAFSFGNFTAFSFGNFTAFSLGNVKAFLLGNFTFLALGNVSSTYDPTSSGNITSLASGKASSTYDSTSSGNIVFCFSCNLAFFFKASSFLYFSIMLLWLHSGHFLGGGILVFLHTVTYQDK